MHKVRLYPSAAQIARLDFMLHQTRHLYNAALQQRKDCWRTRRIGITAKMQQAELTALRAVDPAIAGVYQECEAAVIRRLDLAMVAFFRRLKSGDEPGYPRFKPAARWKQLEFPHGERALKLDAAQTRVRVPGVGTMRLRKGREIPSFGRAMLVEKNGRWSAVFECERDASPLPSTGKIVGIDRGVTVLAATSDGELIENPRHFAARRTTVEAHQLAVEALSTRDAAHRLTNRNDPARLAAVRCLARAKEREANARRDWLHKVSRSIVDRYDAIVLEKLSLRSMTRSAKGTSENPGRNVAAKSGLNRVLLDAGLSILATLIGEKAAWAGRLRIDVDARYSSQTCAACGHIAAENRNGIVFRCVRCGHQAHADTNAAEVICQRGTAELQPMSESTPRSTRFTRKDAA